MIACRNLITPCRAASRLLRKIHSRNISVGVGASTELNSQVLQTQRKCSPASRIFKNQLNQRIRFSSSGVKTLNKIDDVMEREPVSPFEVFRAKALQKGRVFKKEIETLLENMEAKTEEGQLAFLLNCCAEYLPHLNGAQKVEMAEKIWKKFTADGSKIGIVSIIALLNVHIACSQEVNLSEISKAPDVQQLIQKKDVLQLLLESYSECANVAKCAEVVDQMKSLGLPIGDREFGCLILAEGKARNYKGIETILETMDLTSISEGPFSLFSLLRAQILNKKPIIETLKSMQAQGFKLDDEQVAKVLVSLSETNDSKLASTILRQFPVDGVGHVIRNMTIQLIYEGKHKFACEIYHLLLSGCNPEVLTSILAFFPAELVKSGKSSTDILDICLALQTNFPNHNSFLSYAIEESLRDRTKTSLSSALLAHITPVRNHYFWPLIVHSSSMEEAVDVVQQMLDLGLRLDYDTFSYYLYPTLLKWDTPMNIIKHLQGQCHFSITMQLGPMLNALLLHKQIEEALTLCKLIQQRTIDLKRLVRPLVGAVLEKKIFPLSAYLIALLSESKQKFNEVDFVGLFLTEYSLKCQPADLKELFSHLAKFKIRISMATYEILSSRSTVKQVGVQYLDLLTDSSYSGVDSFQPIPHPKNMDVEDLEAHLIELKSKSMNTRGVLRKLLQAHCRDRNVERALQIKKELDAQRCELSPGILSSLLGLYVHIEDVSSATDTLLKIQEYPRFIVDEHKVLDYCKLSVRTGSPFDEVIGMLDDYVLHLKQNRRAPRSMDSRNSLELIGEVKKCFGDSKAEIISNKLSESGFL